MFRKMIIHIYTCDFVFICRFQNASRFCKLSVVQPCVTVSSARIENYRSSTTSESRVICILIAHHRFRFSFVICQSRQQTFL